MSDEKKENFFAHSKKLSRPKYTENLPFRTVYISPFDMNILYFAPAMRRDYLDDVLTRGYAQFASVKKNYENVMRQRNALLKKIREDGVSTEMLDFWDKKFAEISVQYGLYRQKYAEYVEKKIPEFPDFFSKYSVEFSYEAEWMYQKNPENFIIDYLKENRQRDIFSGHTHIGPHRDDFSLQMKNLS